MRPTWNYPELSPPAGSRSRLLRFHLPGFSCRRHCDLFAVIFDGASKLTLNAEPELFRRNDGGGRAETQNPGYQLELAAHMHLHRNAAAANFPHLLGRMPDARTHILGNI